MGGVPPIEDRAYIRELLQLAVVDDLLGPAGGPNEHIVDMSVRDRYLVGKLAPRENARGGIEGLEGPLAEEDVEEPTDPIVPGQHEPGAEFGTATGRVEPESDGSDEIDAASNQSLVPSSFGMTFCVDGDVQRIEIEARWGSYERVPNEEHELTRPNGQKAKVWQRIPCGGKLVLPLAEGVIPHQAPDANRPAVRIQGSIRAKNANGDRLVTLFLINAQEEPDTNRDTAWLFQPELIVRAEAETSNRAIFRRRPVLDADGMDAERWNMLHPDETPRVPYVTEVFADTSGPLVASTDYMKLFADQIRPFVPKGRTYKVLGTDGFGRSDFRYRLREHFEVDRHFVVVGALNALADDGVIPRSKVAEAISRYEIKADKANPARA